MITASMPGTPIPFKHVLIAETRPHMASLVAQMLRSLGCTAVREAYDAHQASKELRLRRFDLLVLDADLAGMDGTAFARRLRTSVGAANRTIPIIMLSAAPEARRIAQARDAGVTEFLRKPFALSHLQTRLTSIAQKPRQFIESSRFSGPDRRRRITFHTGLDQRRGEIDA